MEREFMEEFENGNMFSDLDPATKYCIADTMVVVPMRWGDRDVMAEAKKALSNSTLVLL